MAVARIVEKNVNSAADIAPKHHGSQDSQDSAGPVKKSKKSKKSGKRPEQLNVI